MGTRGYWHEAENGEDFLGKPEDSAHKLLAYWMENQDRPVEKWPGPKRQQIQIMAVENAAACGLPAIVIESLAIICAGVESMDVSDEFRGRKAIRNRSAYAQCVQLDAEHRAMTGKPMSENALHQRTDLDRRTIRRWRKDQKYKEEVWMRTTMSMRHSNGTVTDSAPLD